MENTNHGILNLLRIVFMLANALTISATCTLPNEWYGKWYQSKYTDLKTISRTSFLQKGQCVQSRQDKFIFHEK